MARTAAVVAVVLVGACTAPSDHEGAAQDGALPATSASPASAPATPTTATTRPTQQFAASIHPIDAPIAARMTSSWRPGCPVPLGDLRLARIRHVGMDGAVHDGELIVHADHAEALVAVLRSLFDARFPIQQVRLVDEFGGDDDRSMAANNTSAFNCRSATGTDRWSEHAYGRAVDINPIQNPFVTASGAVLPPEGRPFVDRRAGAAGMILDGGPAVAAFEAIGWRWGGNWSRGRDYQHFSVTGR